MALSRSDGHYTSAPRSQAISTGRQRYLTATRGHLADKVYSTTSPGARKGHNLEQRPECSLAARAPAIDIVLEGSTSWVDDRGLLEQIATAYDSKYGWPVTITSGNMFDAPYGAPTAGPPPYRAYQITPTVAYGLGTSDNLGVRSTRFRFTYQ